ncbi:hypothetical protein [Endothiovibrio diazotrophicus]
MVTIKITKELAGDPVGIVTLSAMVSDAESHGETLEFICVHPAAWKLLRAYDDTRHPSWREKIDEKTRSLLGRG